ncbi:MAG: hypothetical protein HXY41_06950 [Chloroflexi bacterium]|nr:hypothetical protein [Chloroflexota bacterium]
MKFATDDSAPARTFAFVRPTAVLLLIAALLLVALYAAVADGGFPLDDSWIHQVYGRNLAQTGLWAFVPGAPSAASTAPLYTVLLAAGYTLGMPFKLWTHGLGALALAAAGLTGARLAARLMPEQQYIGLAAGLALVGTWHLVWAAASGMETMLFSLWTLALMTLGWDAPEGGWRRGALFGVCAALAALTRPEGVLLAGLVGAAVLAARLPAGRRRWLPWLLGAGAGFVVCIAPYLILNLQLTGGLLPNTAAAKQAEYAPIIALLPYPRRLWEMFRPIFAGGQILLLPGLVYFIVMTARRLRADREKLLFLLPVGWALALVALYAARLPAPYQHGRYVIPALPSLVLVGVVGTAWMLRESRRTLAGRVVSRALAAAGALAFGYFALAGAGIYSHDVDIIDEEMVTAAQWIQTHLPPEDRLAVHDIGAVGYFAPRPILDLAGLVNPEIIPFIRDAAALWDWMQANDARYLMAFPDQIPGQNPDDPRLCRVFVTGGKASPAAGGANMAVYALAWDGICPD